MKKVRKSLTRNIFIMVVVFTFLLTGCGTQSTDNTSGSSSTAASTVDSGAAAASTAAEQIGEFPLKDPVTLTAFTMNQFPTTDYSIDKNYVTDYIFKSTNIKLDFTYNVSGDDGKTKLNILMASGDKLPDIFIATGWSKAETLLYGQQKLILPLNDYLKDAPNWNKLNTESPLRKSDLTLPDGNVYTYGTDSECFHCMFQSRMWVYKPWVDKLNGGKMPTTTDELYEYLKLVKAKDPNGNGKADEIPLTGNIATGGWATDPTTFIINSFIQSNNMLSNTNPIVGAGFVVNGGKVEYQFTKDQFKQALVYLNKLFKEGLLDSQAFTQDNKQNTATNQATPNIVGMAAGGYWPGVVTELLKGKDGPWQDWTVLAPLKGPEGVQYSAYYPSNYFGNCIGVISADCKNPALAMKLFDYLATPEMAGVQGYGPKGIAWDFVTEGTSVDGGTAKRKAIPAKKFQSDGTTPDYSDEGLNFAQYVWESDASIKCMTAAFKNSLLCEDPTRNTEGLLYSFGKTYSQFKPSDDTIMPNVAYNADDAKKIADYSMSIGKYVNQATVQFITGDLNIDTDWQSYLNKLNDMDLKGYLDIQQKAYDTLK